MTNEDRELAEKIISMLLSVPWERREDIISRIKYNDIFCFECGMGSLDQPNPHCQCKNDE